MNPEPTREMVLAWMRRTGKGYKAAAAHHGLPVERVKKWHQRQGQAAASPRPPADEAKPATQAKGEKSAAKAAEAERVARARIALAEALGPHLREQLRESVRHTAAFLAAEPNDDTDWQQRAAAARTIDILLARVPEIMTFDERTRDAAPDTTAQDAQIAAAFGAPAATVTVIDGGKATGST